MVSRPGRPLSTRPGPGSANARAPAARFAGSTPSCCSRRSVSRARSLSSAAGDSAPSGI
jgi:hypothetical protein